MDEDLILEREATEREHDSLLRFLAERADNPIRSIRVVMAGTLVHCNANAIKAGYNRSLDEDALLDELDPNGINLLAPLLMHEHIAGKLAPPHLRCKVFIKIKEHTRPVQAILDISIDDYDTLLTLEEYRKMLEIRDARD